MAPWGAEGVTGEGILQAQRGGNVAGADFLQVFAVVGMHTQDAADALALVLGAVEDGIAHVEDAGVDAEVGQATHVGVSDDLEDKGGQRFVRVRLALFFVAGERVLAADGRDVQGRG